MYRSALHVPIAFVAALAMGGCAQQYHCYQEGPCCTAYHYGTPAPLPYSAYHGCPTPVASSYVGHVNYAPVAPIQPQPSADEPATPSDASTPPPPAPPALQTASFSTEAPVAPHGGQSPFLQGLIRIDDTIGKSQNPPIRQSPLDSTAAALKD